MDNTIPKSEIDKVLRDFDRKKKEDVASEINNKTREIVSSIGTETPLTVLIDIRQVMTGIEKCMLNITENLNLLADLTKENTIKEEQRHQETIAFMSKISEKLSTTPRYSVASPGSILDSPLPAEKYYFRGDQIKSNESLIGCILMHLEQHISRNISIDVAFSDTTHTDFKEWGSAVRVVRGADNMKLSSITSYEAKLALAIVASPVMGRSVSCQIEHISDLCNKCPELMNQVDTIRKRIIRCPGLINTNKMIALAQLKFPYVTIDKVLNISQEFVRVKVSRNVIDLVKTINQKDRVIYATRILIENEQPTAAVHNTIQKK